MSELLPYFLIYERAELRLSPETLVKYQESLGWVLKIVGDMPPQEIALRHVLQVKARCLERNLSAARISSLIYSLKSFLKFCRLGAGLSTMDVKEIRPPRIP